MNLYQKTLASVRKFACGAPYGFTYAADGFAVRKKNIPFKNDNTFSQAWNDVLAVNDVHWGGSTPDIRWRAHTCIWAAHNCLRLDGDFAEFGVNTGILSSMILKNIKFSESGKKFWLFDTYEGIPEMMATKKESKMARKYNATIYSGDIYKIAKNVFSPFPNAVMVKGLLPESIKQADFNALSFVSIDLNSVHAEMAVINAIWDKITPGGLIVLDDYGFAGHEEQNTAWNEFADTKNRHIMTVPTGQGLIVK